MSGCIGRLTCQPQDDEGSLHSIVHATKHIHMFIAPATKHFFFSNAIHPLIVYAHIQAIDPIWEPNTLSVRLARLIKTASLEEPEPF